MIRVLGVPKFLYVGALSSKQLLLGIFLSSLLFHFFSSYAHAQAIAVSPENMPPYHGDRPPIDIDDCPANGVVVSLTPGLMAAHSRHTVDRAKYRWGRFDVSTAGFYHIYNEYLAESGASQLNEHGFLTIPNAANPGGKPLWGNCGDYWVSADSDNSSVQSGLEYAGTFWLEAGSNPIGLASLCPFIRKGFCTDFENPSATTACSSWQQIGPLGSAAWTNSVHFTGPTVCLVPTAAIANNLNNNAFTHPVQLNEDFESIPIGGQAANWTDTTFNLPFPLVQNSLFRVLDLNGNRVLAASQNTESQFSTYEMPRREMWKSIYWRNYEYTGRILYSHSSGSIGATILADLPESNYHYALKTEESNREFHLGSAQTQFTSGEIRTGVTPRAGIWYRFKIQAVDSPNRTEIRAKVWEDNTNEPISWQAEAFDASQSRISVGSVGVWGGADSQGEKYYDDLTVQAIP